MSTPAYYRAEAERCRTLAAASPDSSAVKRWLQLALEYEQLAENLGRAPLLAGNPQVQQVAMQQQQLKTDEPPKLEDAGDKESQS
jgi:hypothetical protein